MGFFTQNGGYASPPSKAADTGVYQCRLDSIECVSRQKFNSEEMEPTYKWTFYTTEVGDDEGNPYKFVHFTKTKYGPEQAKLTILIDQMLGKHLTESEFNNLSLDELKAKPWAVSVDAVVNAKGYDANVILAVKPLRKLAQEH